MTELKKSLIEPEALTDLTLRSGGSETATETECIVLTVKVWRLLRLGQNKVFICEKLNEP